MESLGLHGIYMGDTERESEIKALTTLLEKNIRNLFSVLYMCVFNEHFLYKSEKDRQKYPQYFNAH